MNKSHEPRKFRGILIKTVTIAIGSIIVIVVVIATTGSFFYDLWETITMNIITPQSPSDLRAEIVLDHAVILAWKDNSMNEEGFLFYRDGKQIAKLQKNCRRWFDFKLESGTTYVYGIRAYNQAGESDTASCSVKTCQ